MTGEFSEDMTRDELHERMLEQWGRVADKMTEFGEVLDKLGDAVQAAIKAMELIGNEFDALGPILAELEEDEDESDERGDLTGFQPE